ncbi:hypothetical protein F4859DRAFT_481848 [Xylaria cf. heliscus]|nr:hypothetical protein F4859DRAFT_481848 [Xylaria cf. heliscus]
MEPRPPQPDWVFEREWHWDAWRFGMGMDELFTTLHSQFNTWSAPLQSFEAFHHDVWEISKAAATKEDLFLALEKRKKKRCEEMARVWDFMAIYMTAGRSILPDDHWIHGIRFFRTRSLDHMLAFLYEFLEKEEREEVKMLNEKLGRQYDDQEKDKDEEDEDEEEEEEEGQDLWAGVSIGIDDDLNNTPTLSTTPRPLKRGRDQSSPTDGDSDYHPDHCCKRKCDTNHNIIVTSPPADDKDNNKHDDVSAIPTPTLSPPTPLGKETQLDQHISSQPHPSPLPPHSPTLSLSSPPSASFSASPPVNTTTEIVNTNFGSGPPQQQDLRQGLQLQKQSQRLPLSRNDNSNKNRITKRGRRIITRGKSKAIKPRPKRITKCVTPAGEKGSSLTTTTADDITATATTSTSTAQAQAQAQGNLDVRGNNF